MEIFAVFFVAGQSGNTKVECGGGIGKEAQTAFKKRRCRESKGTVQEKGRKDSENGEPRNVRNPRGSRCSKNGVGTQRGGLSFLRATLPLSAREFCHSSPKLRLSPSELEVPPSRFSFPRATPGFLRASFACRASFAFPEQTSSFSAQAESLPVRFPPHAGFLCFFGGLSRNFIFFILIREGISPEFVKSAVKVGDILVKYGKKLLQDAGQSEII